MPSTTPKLSQNLTIQGTEQLQSEVLRSRLVDAIASHVNQVGADPAGLEFTLHIKW